MLRFHQLYFLNFALIFGATFLILSIFTYFEKKESEEDKNREVLSSFLILSEPLFEDIILGDNRETLKNLSSTKDIYISLFDGEERKIYPQGADEEIESINTIKDGKLLEVSREIEIDGNIYIIKAATKIKNIWSEYFRFWLNLSLSFTFGMIIAFFIARKINLSALKEVEKVKEYLRKLSEKNYHMDIEPSFIKEFEEIGFIIEKVAKHIEKKDKKYRKKTAGLRLRNRQNNEILSAISHEFKNPIAIIMGYSETLTEDSELDPSIRAKFLDKIYFNSKKLSALIDRLTLSVKLENKSLEMNITEFDIKGVCLDVKFMLEEKHKNREIIIEGNPRLIKGDKTLMEVVITNLTDNALKYSSSDVVIHIDINKISVIDSGIGLSNEEISLVTKKFYRADNNSWNSSLGLGLSIVRYILKLHETTLEIESKSKEGSIFSFAI